MDFLRNVVFMICDKNLVTVKGKCIILIKVKVLVEDESKRR